MIYYLPIDPSISLYHVLYQRNVTPPPRGGGSLYIFKSDVINLRKKEKKKDSWRLNRKERKYENRYIEMQKT